jgi:hypothetical protein
MVIGRTIAEKSLTGDAFLRYCANNISDGRGCSEVTGPA